MAIKRFEVNDLVKIYDPLITRQGSIGYIIKVREYPWYEIMITQPKTRTYVILYPHKDLTEVFQMVFIWN